MEENSEAKYLLGDVNHTAEPYSALTASNDRPPPPYNPEGSLLSQTHLQPGQPHPLQQNNPLAPYPSAPERPPPYSSGFSECYSHACSYVANYYAPINVMNTRDLTRFSVKFSSTGAKKLAHYVPTSIKGFYRDLIKIIFGSANCCCQKPQRWGKCRCQPCYDHD